MSLFLGIDTGGTYTDAIIYDDAAPDTGIIHKAKALTTRHDLSIGIGNAIGTVLQDGPAPGDIRLVSISTTLATNALVEQRGGRVCLVLIGFDDKVLSRAGLADAVKDNPIVRVAGGHSATGERQARLDISALHHFIQDHRDTVDAFAVVAHFGVRDPVDEVQTRDLIAARCKVPVTCGHELSSDLNGPKRALTCFLNAQLISMIADLIRATEAVMAHERIEAPLMMVRGDGSLVSSDFARDRPIETILSGPAASLVGAAHLTGRRNAIVSDIGGTTTDVAVMEDGRPRLNPNGATVGGHVTMVRAVDMHTHGLGGDSEVRVDESSLTARLILGPQRRIPLALFAQTHPKVAHRALDRQLANAVPRAIDAQFAMISNSAAQRRSIRADDQAILSRLADGPMACDELLATRSDHAALKRLVQNGSAQISAFTPTDASHVLDLHAPWDSSAAMKGAELLARQRNARGAAIDGSATDAATRVHSTLIWRSAEILISAALDRDGLSAVNSRNELITASMKGHQGTLNIDIGISDPVIGLGASAPIFYPSIAKLLHNEAIVPPDADVANAIGAVVGQVRVTAMARVDVPGSGRFRLTLPETTCEFTSEEAARCAAESSLQEWILCETTRAGAVNPAISMGWTDKTVHIDGQNILIESVLDATGSGRPKLAD